MEKRRCAKQRETLQRCVHMGGAKDMNNDVMGGGGAARKRLGITGSNHALYHVLDKAV